MICLPHMYLSESEMCKPPVSVVIFKNISVTGSLNLVSAEISVCENRIIRIWSVWSPDIFTAWVIYHMTIFCTALGFEKIVVFTEFIDVWCFEETAACSVPKEFALGKLFACININLAHLDASSAVSIISIAYKIAFVILKIEWRVNTVLVYNNRFRPFSINIISIYIEILMITVIGCYHIKSAVVVSDSRRKDTAWTAYSVKVNLWSSCETMTDLFPVYHISAFIKRNTGENVHWTAYHIIFSVCSADAWVRIETSYNWI